MDKPSVGDYIDVLSDRDIDNGPWTHKVVSVKGNKYKVEQSDHWYEIDNFSHVHEKNGEKFFTVESMDLEEIIIINQGPEKARQEKLSLQRYTKSTKEAEKALDNLFRDHEREMELTLEKGNSSLLYRAKELLGTISRSSKEFQDGVDSETGELSIRKIPKFKVKESTDLNEMVTSDDIPDRLGTWEPVELKKKRDKLYQQRLKKNPKLKDNIKKIGERMMHSVTFTSKNQDAISRQWHLMFHLDDKSWNSWDISNISVNGGSYSFTLKSYAKDQRLMDDEYLQNHLVAGVNMNLMQEHQIREEEFNGCVSLVEMDLDPSTIVDMLLSESSEVVVKTEASVFKDLEKGDKFKILGMGTSDEFEKINRGSAKNLSTGKTQSVGDGVRVSKLNESEQYDKGLTEASRGDDVLIKNDADVPKDQQGKMGMVLSVKGDTLTVRTVAGKVDVKLSDVEVRTPEEESSGKKTEGSVRSELALKENVSTKKLVKTLDQAGDSLDSAFNLLKSSLSLVGKASFDITGDNSKSSNTGKATALLKKYINQLEDLQYSLSDLSNGMDDTMLESVLEAVTAKSVADLKKNDPKKYDKYLTNGKEAIKKAKTFSKQHGQEYDMEDHLFQLGYTDDAIEVWKHMVKSGDLKESFIEAEVPDDEDAESDTIDDVQSMLTKMLPKTKGLKLDPSKEKELKSTLKKAMSMMGESIGKK
jgi:hypothetical protein